MNVRFKSAVAILAVGLVLPLQALADQLIPRSATGDKGKYYLVEFERNGSIVGALHKRVGPSGVGFTRTETNCDKWEMRELGYGDDSVENISGSPTKWFALIPGSSKADLAKFVCALGRESP